MDIKIIALCLLALRMISVGFLVAVLHRQLSLIRLKNYPEVGALRKVLLALVLVILLGQFIPILIDTVTLFANIRRSNPNPLGVAYAFSNAFTSAMTSVLLWTIYRVSGTSTHENRSPKSRTRKEDKRIKKHES